MSPVNGVKWLTTLVPLVASAIAAFTAVAGLAVVGGGANRMLLNHPQESAVALACIASAVAFAAVATLASANPHAAIKASAAAFVTVSLVAFVVGLAFAIGAARETAEDHSQPVINADVKVESGTVRLEAVIKASGVPATDHVSIRVYPSDRDQFVPTTRIYQSDGGPDADGNFETNIALPIPLNGKPYILIEAYLVEGNHPDCSQLKAGITDQPSTLGCLLLELPAPDVRPQLTVSADGDPKAGVLAIKVSQAGIPTGQSISLEVSGKSKGVRKAIYRALVQQNGWGAVSDEVRVAVPAGFTDVCIAAKLGSTWNDASCPPDADQGTTWVMLGASSLTR